MELFKKITSFLTHEIDQIKHDTIKLKTIKEYLLKCENLKNRSDLEEVDLTSLIDQLKKLKNEIEENVSKYFIDNLKQKEVICLELERVYGQEDKGKTLTLLYQAKKKWIQIGPVNSIDYPIIESRFKNDCDRLTQDCSEYLKQKKKERQESLVRRKKIIQTISTLNQEPEKIIQHHQKVRQLIKDWKQEISLSKKDLALNQKFKHLLDEFYKHLQVFFEQQKLDQQNNFKKKKILHHELEKLTSQINSEDEWKKNKNKLLTVYKNWLKIKSFTNQEHTQIDEQFYQVFEKTFNRYQEKLEDRIQKKLTLITQLEELSRSQESEKLSPEKLLTSAEKIMELQFKWKQFIPIPIKQYHQLKKKFDQTLTLLIQKNPQLTEIIDQLKSKNYQTKKNLLLQLEEHFQQEPSSQTHQEVMNLIQSWEKVGAVTNQHYLEVEKPFKNLLDQYFKNRRIKHKHKHKIEKENYQKKKKLIDQLKILKNKFIAPEQDSEITPEKLKLALELNRQLAYTNNKQIDLGRKEAVKQIQKSWGEIGPVEKNKEYNLFREYRELCNQLYRLK